MRQLNLQQPEAIRVPFLAAVPASPRPTARAASVGAAANLYLMPSPRALGLALHFLAAEAMMLGFHDAANCAGAAGEFFVPSSDAAVKAIAVAPVDQRAAGEDGTDVDAYTARLLGFLSCLALFKTDFSQVMANDLACARFFSHPGDKAAVSSLVAASWMSLQTVRHFLRFVEERAVPPRGARKRMRLVRRRISLAAAAPLGAVRRVSRSVPAQLAA